MVALNAMSTPWMVAGGFASLLGYFIIKLVSHRQFYKDKVRGAFHIAL